jgi:hypothetical protein
MDKSIETKKSRSVVPAVKPLTEQQLFTEIENAEKGSFMSVEEGMKDFEQCVQARERK